MVDLLSMKGDKLLLAQTYLRITDEENVLKGMKYIVFQGVNYAASLGFPVPGCSKPIQLPLRKKPHIPIH